MSREAAPNLATLWARTLAEIWAAAGLEHVCPGSGSRSAPLVEAFGRIPGITLHPHVDERSAAFFALGIAARTGRPAAVVTTSGTAAANLYPAVVEAAQSGIPLLVVTADRPARLRGLDANQTIDQVDLFGRYPRLALDLPAPRPAAGDLAALEDAAVRAWAATRDAPGPVHVNVQLEKPLEPTPVAGAVSPALRAAGRDPAEILRAAARPAGDAPDGPSKASRRTASLLAEALARAERPLLVVGPTHDPAIGPAVVALARAGSTPVVADPLSGARWTPRARGVVAGGADIALRDPEVASGLTPDLVVRIGPTPTSAACERFLAGLRGTRQIALTSGGRWPDHDGVLTDTLYVRHRDVPGTLEAAAEAASGERSESWLDRWRSVDLAVSGALATELDEIWFEGAIARGVADRLLGGTWFIGNSMPIRDVDAFGGTDVHATRTVGFRGASGIDGNVSAALGMAAAGGGPAAALIGDLTLLHDVSALLRPGARDIDLAIVVIQNRGGGIFHMLPIREFDPPFTPHIVMPHDVDLAQVAAAAAIPHRPVASVTELREGLETAWREGGLHLLEARTDRQENMERREAVIRRAREAARAVL